MITTKAYKFKTEFCKELNIPLCQAERRLDDLLDWLTNFYDFEFLRGRPNRILITKVIEEYEPMPAKWVKRQETTEQKKKDYEDFTLAALGTEFKPNSKSKIARDAIAQFGRTKYNHMNPKSVAERYVKEPFDKYGETNNEKLWVYYSTYTPLGERELEHWRAILADKKIGETEAANAFYRQEQGEDISKEKQYYKEALEIFESIYFDRPVLVKKWRANIFQ